MRITVQPATRAGINLRSGETTGKFHGVMAVTTPIGSRNVYARRSRRPLGSVSASDAQGLSGGEACLAEGTIYLAAGLDDGLAHLHRHRRRELLFAPFADAYETVDVFSALGGGDAPPTQESVVGRLYSPLDVLLRGRRESPDDLAGLPRIPDFVRLAGTRGDPLAADVVPVRSCLLHRPRHRLRLPSIRPEKPC